MNAKLSPNNVPKKHSSINHPIIRSKDPEVSIKKSMTKIPTLSALMMNTMTMSLETATPILPNELNQSLNLTLTHSPLLLTLKINTISKRVEKYKF